MALRTPGQKALVEQQLRLKRERGAAVTLYWIRIPTGLQNFTSASKNPASNIPERVCVLASGFSTRPRRGKTESRPEEKVKEGLEA